MLYKHETSSLIVSLTSQDVIKTFENAYTSLQKLLGLDNLLKEFNKGSMDEDEFLDGLECLGEIPVIPFLEKFSAGYCSTLDVLNKYLERTMVSLKQIIKDQRVIMDTYCAPVGAEYDSMSSCLHDAIAGISFFLYYEFSLSDTLNSKEDDDPVVDEILFSYAGEHNLNYVEVAEYIEQISKDYKMPLEIFDEYPDKEVEFEKIMGPYYVGVASANLTIELVDKVINGEITPEELYTLLLSDESDDE